MTHKCALVISPRFPPTNAADSHRVRLSVKYYMQFGWRPIVLCAIDTAADSDDWRLFFEVAETTRVVRVKPWDEARCRLFGFRQIEFRSFVPMLVEGLKIIRREKVILAFFSTTAFTTFLLGPIWKLFSKLRVVYDIQDPWYHGSQLPYKKGNSPGSWYKYRALQSFAQFAEPIALRHASHIISVSQGYIESLSLRYGLSRDNFTLLPFPGAFEDFALARSAKQSIFADTDGKMHWVYAGRAGPDLDFAIRIFFRGLAEVIKRRPGLKDKLLIHFVGTNYAPGDRTYKVVEPIANDEGVSSIVVEHSERIRYLEVLDLYQSADVVLLFGSTNSSYTASKLINCLLSQRPLFAVFHEKSHVRTMLRDLPSVLGVFYTDQSTEIAKDISKEIEHVLDMPFTFVPTDFEPWLAVQNAKIQCQIFDKVVST